MDMQELFFKYILRLYHYVPSDLYMVLLSVFCILSIIIIAFKGIKEGSKVVAGLFCVEYVILLIYSTVVLRKTGGTIGCNFTPFWSYFALKNSHDELLAENIMNVAVFTPIGISLSCISKRLKFWTVVIIGMSISLTIEIMQYVYKCGFSEFDDIFHNTLGCAIGVMIVAIIKIMWSFCSFLFVPQWGKNKANTNLTD
jgi:glycopeptide antibiotics resistance protein